MRFLEAGAALLAVVLRVAALVMRAWEDDRPVRATEWLWDWVVVLTLFWLGVALAKDAPRARSACFVAASLWLALIYASHQLHHTFWLFGVEQG